MATSPEHEMRRDHLADLLWPDSEHRAARRSLRQSVYYLSKQTGLSLIDSDDSRLSLETERFDCDVWRFDRAVRSGDHRTVLDALSGRFLERMERKLGRELGEWVELQNERIRRARRAAYLQVIEQAVEAEDEDTALRYARRYASRNPLDDTAQLCLIRTLKAVGDDAGAFRAYEEYRSAVRAAVGDEPSAAVEEAVGDARQLLLDDPEWKPIAGPEPEPLTRRTAGRYAAGVFLAGALLGGGALALAMAGSASGRTALPPNSTLETASAGLVVTRVGDSLLYELRIDGDEYRLSPLDRCGRIRYGSPEYDGVSGRVADLAVGENGIDLHVVDCHTGRREPLLTERADERALHWSPDGRQILFSHGRVDGEGRYVETLMAVDAADGSPREIVARNSLGSPSARWSPDGTRIAYEHRYSGGGELWVVGTDGRDPRRLETGFEWSGHPAWSPDGDLLAFVAGTVEERDLYVMSAGGGVVERLTDLPGEPFAPTWLSRALIAFTVRDPGGPELWIVDRITGESRRITEGEDIYEIVGRRERSPEADWIDRVVADVPARASPGQWFEPRVHLVTVAGDTVATPPDAIRWTIEDPSVIATDEGSMWRVRRVGETSVVASLRGWRADTVRVVSVPLDSVALEPWLVETWNDGIRPDRWIPFGEPCPYVRPDGGPGGAGAFVNNGDENYPSGVVSAGLVDTSRGVTIEAWGTLPFTAPVHQRFEIMLTGPGDEWDVRGPLSWLYLLRASSDPGSLALGGDRANVHLAGLADPERWRPYVLQLGPDGEVAALADGRLLWRGHGLVTPERIPPRARVRLSGTSRGTSISHGPVRVYEGVRYVIP